MIPIKNRPIRPAALFLALSVALSACESDPGSGSQSETSPPEIPATTDLLPAGAQAEPPSPTSGQAIARDLPTLGFIEISAKLPVSGSWRGYPDLIDFTGDGRAELVVSNRKEDGWNLWTYMPGENFSEGVWEPRIEGLSRYLMYGGQDGIDVDLDGDLDLVLCSHQAGVRVYRNDGSASWSEEGPIPETVTLVLDVCSLDLNGDKYRDLVGIGQFKGGINLYLGNEEGSFDLLSEASKKLIGFERKAFGMQVEAGDLDGDGDDDVVAAAVNGVRAFLTDRDENGELTWRERSRGLPRTERIGNILRGLDVAHVITGSERPQVAFVSLADPGSKEGEGNTIGVLDFDVESGSWSKIDTGLWSDASYSDLKTADFNLDGHLDLVVSLQGIGVVLFLGDGKGGFEPAGRIEGIRNKAKLAVGDINKDGRPDLAASTGGEKGKAPGAVQAFLNDAGAF